MGCLENYDWKAKELDKDIYRKIKSQWDHIAKPLDGMGDFEQLLAQIGAIQGSTHIQLEKKAVLIYCGDNGIVEEGISQSGQEVTLQVLKNMAKRESSVGRMALAGKIDTIPVDVGVNSEEIIPFVQHRKVRKGTRNFRKEPAMTKEEALLAMEVGMDLVRQCKEDGYHILGVGEMGIGNTTTSSAVTAALLGCDVSEVTGRGAGLDDEKLMQKRNIIEEAVEKYHLKKASPFTILQTVGGYDLCALVGTYLGGARYEMPIVLDGVISLAAALVAERLVPSVSHYLVPSHIGKEPAAKKLLEVLQKKAPLQANLALGEGTGAVMMMSLLDLALAVYEEGASFREIQVTPYERYQ